MIELGELSNVLGEPRDLVELAVLDLERGELVRRICTDSGWVWVCAPRFG